ncbi:MAG: DUF4388 domain-containing protein [Planctomycetota bacterium]|nr:DUF4388 domain-containing protein [Planctomycetota bacterium]
MSSLKGHLEHFGLQELLQTLSHGSRTGTLQIERNDEKVAIVFETGHITFVRTGVASQIRLRSILLRCNLVSEGDLQTARKDQKETGMLLGRALLERGVLDDDQLAQALRLKAEEELFDLFLWEDGTFEFFPELIQPAAEDEISQVTRIKVDPMSVIIEGLRQADEWKIIRDRINDLRWILVPAEGVSPPAESHSIWKMIDGRRSIDAVLGFSAGTRFDTCSILYRFLEEGIVREATQGEMLKVARGSVSKAPASALSIYQALIERAGNSLGHELLDEAADCASHIDTEAEAEFIRRSIAILRSRGDEAGAWIRMQRLLVLSPGNMDDLKTAWILRDNIPTRRIESILDDLVKSLRRCGDHRQMITVLREAESMRDDDANYWLLLGEALQRCKEPEAEVCLSKAIQMSRNQEPEIALRAEKILRSLDSDMALDEDLIEQLRNRRTVLDSSKKLRKGIIFVSAAMVCVVILWHVSSEWRARGLLAAARNIEADGSEITALVNAAKAYERVASEHPWTFAGSSGASEGTRLRGQIDQRRENEFHAKAEDLEKERSRRLKKVTEIRSIISTARSLRKKGDAIAARNALATLSSDDLKILPEIELNGLKIPVVIKSKPAGARIFAANRSFLGTSPVIVDLSLNESRDYFVERSGCRSRKVNLSGTSPAVVTVSLVRGPLRTYSLPGPVSRSTLAGNMLITSGTDGKIRIVDVSQLHPVSEHAVGIEGHPAPLMVNHEKGVLVVPTAGRSVLVGQDGEVLPFGPNASAPFSAASSMRQGWAIGDADGQVMHLDSQGKTTWKFGCYAPISLLASSLNGGLWIVDRSRALHQVDSDGKRIGSEILLPGDAIELFPDGRVLLEEGTTWKRNQITRGPAPSTSSRKAGRRNYYGTTGGWAVLEDNRIKQYLSPSPTSCAPLEASGSSGATWIAGRDGILRLQQSDGKIDSEVELGSPAVNLHRSSRGRILVTLADGRLCDVEEIQR